jgi:NAD(P)-dependent dehydrogenase (short-subunit alcohol dehydrogenase family)
MDRLRDKIAIVTGAAHGIGRAIAEQFALEGAAVLVADIDETAGEETAAIVRARGQAASFVHCDVQDDAAVERAVKLAGGKTGRVDILCNNAGWLIPWHDVLSASADEWDKCYRVYIRGAAGFIRCALPFMLAHKRGSIINVASVQGMVGARQSPAYTAMKHALIGLSRNVAYDFGPQNIRCNALCPGPIQTRISPQPGSEAHQRQVAKTMLARTGEAVEVAHAAVFLASDESSYVTGAVIPVDGGWTAM